MRFENLFKYCPVCGSSAFNINNIKSKHCNDCGFTMYVNPSAAVAAFIFNKNNELLVCIRGNEPEKGTFDLPGGFIDYDETAENALIRELKEELGVIVTSIKYEFSLPNEYKYSGWTLPTLDIFFRVEIESYDNIVPADDVQGFKFIAIDHLNPDDFGLKSIKKAVTILKNESDSERFL